jgi:hypothetical protein
MTDCTRLWCIIISISMLGKKALSFYIFIFGMQHSHAATTDFHQRRRFGLILILAWQRWR